MAETFGKRKRDSSKPRFPTSKMREEWLAQDREERRARAEAAAVVRLDLIDRDPHTLTGPERMDRARAVSFLDRSSRDG